MHPKLVGISRHKNFTRCWKAGLMLLLLSVAGCANTTLYLSESGVSQDPVTVHLTRYSNYSGAVYGVVLFDAGEGANFNAVIVASEVPGIFHTTHQTLYVGPLNGAQQFRKPFPQLGHSSIGEPSDYCGIQPNFLRTALEGGDFRSLEDAYVCLDEFGKYIFLKETYEDRLLSVESKNQDKSNDEIRLALLEALNRAENRPKHSFTIWYRPVSLIGHIANGDSIIWTRPDGVIEILAYWCRSINCESERNLYKYFDSSDSIPPYAINGSQNVYIEIGSSREPKISNRLRFGLLVT